MTKERFNNFADLNEKGQFHKTPKRFPNIFRGDEFPLHFFFDKWAESVDELPDGAVIGHSNGQFPQVLVWSQGQVIAISKERHERDISRQED
jgi:hypothetical protein